jgi:hypothetical protein
LSIATAGVSNAMLANSSLTISPGADLTGGGSVALGGSTTLSLDTTKVPLLAAANTFSTNQTVNGSVTASSFSGNGSALTNITAGNSSELGGLGSSAYAQLAAANTFSNSQTVNGMLTATSSSTSTSAIYGSSSGQSAIYGNSTAADYSGVFGFGLGYGVSGVTDSTSGVGVGGFSEAATGTTSGVYGQAASPSGYGVYGLSDYIGVAGYANSGAGVYGLADTSSGYSVQGPAGVWGDNGDGSDGGAGVLGTASNDIGGFFANGSTAHPTLFSSNVADAAGGEAFEAYIESIGAQAVIGDPGCNTGFIALQLGQFGMSGCSNYTMAGGNNGHTYINAVTGAAVHLRIDSVDQLTVTSGNVDVLGTLSKGGGSFKIDHPLDPANKYLYHSFVESPDMKNMYDGNVTTDDAGLATVTLPNWFETLNRDFRYQLTVIGQFAQAIVASEISGNQFSIRTDKPDVKVSWQVTGTRQDAFANAHRIQVEAEKAPADRGHYLYPELVGAPETARIGYMAPAPGSGQIVHQRPAIQKRGSASPSQQRTPPGIPVPPKPVAPKIAQLPNPRAPASKLEVNQK